MTPKQIEQVRALVDGVLQVELEWHELSLMHYCPLCGMNDDDLGIAKMKHTSDCPYLLAKQLKEQLNKKP